MRVRLRNSLKMIGEESERRKARCQVITKHIAIRAFIRNKASRRGKETAAAGMLNWTSFFRPLRQSA